jgi:hypothetical protein
MNCVEISTTIKNDKEIKKRENRVVTVAAPHCTFIKDKQRAGSFSNKRLKKRIVHLR